MQAFADKAKRFFKPETLRYYNKKKTKK